MLIFRYLTKEVLKSQLAVFLTLMTIFISHQLVRVLGEATEGNLPEKLIFSRIALELPQLASYILPLSVFLGIILAYSRIYADSEMTVLKACGISEWYVVRVTLFSSVLMASIAASISLYLSPWAKEQELQLREQADAEAGLALLKEGRFQETGNEEAVVFIHDIQAEGSLLKKVFVAQLPKSDEDESARIVYAEQGRVIEKDSGEQQLILENGKRYETDMISSALNLTQFSQYQIQIQEQAIEQRRRKLEAISTKELLSQDSLEAKAQLQWRVAVPLSIVILTFIAVPLSAVNPRQGKFAKMLPALGLYLGYFLLLMAGRFAIEDGKIPVSAGLWWIHLSALFIGAILILKGRPLGQTLAAFISNRQVSA